MEAEGRRVVTEVADPGEKRWMSERPGLEKIKGLAAAGEIDEVWAWAWDRYGQSPIPELLAIELAEHSVRLRSLDDGGEGLGGEILRAVGSVLSREDQHNRVRKSAMGKRSKVRRGQILGASPKPRYGFRFIRNNKGKVVGYEVHREEMAVVRTIFEMLDDGLSIHAVQTALEADSVSAPQGGLLWSRETIRNIVREDSYMPHALEELAALVDEGLMGEEVYSSLDPSRPYGITYYGRTKSSYVSIRSKKRKVEPAPRHECTAVPVDLTDSGLERGRVERVRRAIEDNRASAKVGDRFWELSRGFLFCADCGRAMVAYARRFKSKTKRNHFYYRCDQRRKVRGTALECPNRKAHRAEELEHEAVLLFERYADRGTLLDLYDRAVEEHNERSGLRHSLERRSVLGKRLGDLEVERKGYLRQNARGVLSDSELDAMLSDVDAQREQIVAELRAVEDAAAVTRRIQAARYALVHGE